MNPALLCRFCLIAFYICIILQALLYSTSLLSFFSNESQYYAKFLNIKCIWFARDTFALCLVSKFRCKHVSDFPLCTRKIISLKNNLYCMIHEIDFYARLPTIADFQIGWKAILWSKMLILFRVFHKLIVLPHLCPPQKFWPLMRAFNWGTI